MTEVRLDSLPKDGLLAVYRGTEFSAGTSMSGPEITLYFDSRADWLAFPADEVLTRGERPGGPYFVDVPRATIERLFTRAILASWFGEPVVVHKRVAENIEILYNRDPSFGAAMGMTGNQYEGWRKVVPFHELEDVQITERDHPPVR